MKSRGPGGWAPRRGAGATFRRFEARGRRAGCSATPAARWAPRTPRPPFHPPAVAGLLVAGRRSAGLAIATLVVVVICPVVLGLGAGGVSEVQCPGVLQRGRHARMHLLTTKCLNTAVSFDGKPNLQAGIRRPNRLPPPKKTQGSIAAGRRSSRGNCRRKWRFQSALARAPQAGGALAWVQSATAAAAIQVGTIGPQMIKHELRSGPSPRPLRPALRAPPRRAPPSPPESAPAPPRHSAPPGRRGERRLRMDGRRGVRLPGLREPGFQLHGWGWAVWVACCMGCCCAPTATRRLVPFSNVGLPVQRSPVPVPMFALLILISDSAA